MHKNANVCMNVYLYLYIFKILMTVLLRNDLNLILFIDIIIKYSLKYISIQLLMIDCLLTVDFSVYLNYYKNIRIVLMGYNSIIFLLIFRKRVSLVHRIKFREILIDIFLVVAKLVCYNVALLIFHVILCSNIFWNVFLFRGDLYIYCNEDNI